ncbi:MAG TPA: AAC(3) family N-acetyltransferase [Alphaproteobacteria bacterium]|nr:AAC(3) family N-acetyltransferase [Alphaproteobacteria bacterium]
MRGFARAELEAALRGVGIGPGDDVMVHSSLIDLGRPEGGVAMCLEAVRGAIGEAGTLCVPTFTFPFCRGAPFDRAATPSTAMGAFSEAARRDPAARRTRHAIQSLALIGPRAAEMEAVETASAYAAGSAFARLVERGFKILLLGAGPLSISLTHLCEEWERVPYRYWKSFAGPVRMEPGADFAERSYAMYVRDLALDPRLDERPLCREMAERGLWREVRLNGAPVAACRMADFAEAATARLRRDPFALLSNGGTVRAALG